MSDTPVTYTLVMSSAQARVVNKAIDLLMRLKLKQYGEIPPAVLNWGAEIGCDEYCKRRDHAEPHLRIAFDALFPTWDGVRKSLEWNRLYDLHQVIRKAIHDAEHPQTTGVDSYPPLCTAGEKMAKCTFEKGEEQ